MSLSLRMFACAVLAGASSLSAQTLQPPFDTLYTYTDLGGVPDVPSNYGGLTIKYNDPNTLLIGGAANGPAGAIYSVPVVRDGGGHIIGFGPASTVFCQGDYNDGGVAYGPGNVLFVSRWPVNQLGQVRPGSIIQDRIIDLAAMGVDGSHAAVNFVPAGNPGAGRIKLVSWAGGAWYDAAVVPDGAGTYSLVGLTTPTSIYLTCGPEGFVYVPSGSAGFPVPAILVSEYSCGNVATYDVDANGDPILATRRIVLSGLFGAEGAAIDPVTGDFLFSTFGGGSHVVVVRGFALGVIDCDANGRIPDCFNPRNGGAAPYASGGPDNLDDDCQCVANWNRDLEVNSNDVSDFLNAWFSDLATGGLTADIADSSLQLGCDGESNSNDVSLFLNLWFAAVSSGAGGCPIP